MAVQGNTAEKLEEQNENRETEPSRETATVVHMRIGTILQTARKENNQKLDPIANELNIRVDYLKAIEENTLQDLPEPVYVMGYIRSYASYLGLDPNEAIRIYKLEERPNTSNMNLVFPKADNPRSLPKQNVLIASGALLLALLAGWAIMQNDLTDKKDAPAATTVAMPQKNEPSISPVSSGNASENAKVTLNATDDVWIEIRDEKNKILVSKTLKKGETYAVPDKDGLVMHTGNAAGLTIKVDEEALPPLGEKGMTRRNISLDPKKLLQDKSAS